MFTTKSFGSPQFKVQADHVNHVYCAWLLLYYYQTKRNDLFLDFHNLFIVHSSYEEQYKMSIVVLLFPVVP